METTFYSGPYEGMYTRDNFLKALSNVEEFKENIRSCGRYDIPNRDGNGGVRSFRLVIGKNINNINSGRILHTSKYTTRNNPITSFFMGPKIFEETEIKIFAKRRAVLEGIEKVLEDVLSSE